MFALVERYIDAKTLVISEGHRLGDQLALEALVRMADEELKHQELFHRLDAMAAAGMPAGYVFVPEPNDFAATVLGKSTWAVLGLTLDVELFSQAHYRSSIDPDPALSELWKDVFLFHWKEESQHAVIDELEWIREDAKLASSDARDAAVDDLIALVGGVDGIVQGQAAADAEYFLRVAGMPASRIAASSVSTNTSGVTVSFGRFGKTFVSMSNWTSFAPSCLTSANSDVSVGMRWPSTDCCVAKGLP